MSWKSLKTFAIVILLIMDIVLALFAAERKYAVTYYDDALIDSAVSVFSESGIYLDRSFLEKKRISPAVYTGTSSAQVSDEIAEAMAQKGYRFEQNTEGTRFSCEKDEFFFGNDFGFSYFTQNTPQMPTELLENGIWTVLAEGDEKNAVLQTALSFFDAYALSDEQLMRYCYKITCADVYTMNGEYIVKLLQCLDGIILENGVYLLISEGEVRSAEGRLCTVFPTDKKTAENIGVINVLFEEKAYIDGLAEKMGAHGHTVADISYSYGLYFDADGAFYLVPLCRISYTNGEERVYNFVSGKRFA